jgi:CBS domain containing-hemolysin-like protein
MKLLLIAILLLGLANAILFDKALAILSPKELKRRARGHDRRAAKIFRAAAYGHSLNIMLWVKGVVCATLIFILLLSNSWLAALIFIAVLAWSVRVWHPASTGSFAWSWAALTAPAIAWAMNYLQPIFRRLSFMARESSGHHGVYEKEDLADMLADQAKQPENRIQEEDLRIAAGALTFGDLLVGKVMTPLRQAKLVSGKEQIGPLLMDELHASGFSRFPVTKEGSDKSRPEIVGTLYIKDLVAHSGSGRIDGLIDKKV